MATPVPVLSRCLGLNTKDHPTEFSTEAGQYLYKGINVDVDDNYNVERRDGYSVVESGFTSAHSLCPYLDTYAIFADGVKLYAYNVNSGSLTTLKSDMTPNKAISYTKVGDDLVFSNGIERGVVKNDLSCESYYSFVADKSQANREITAFPLVDLMHYYRGSMYGASTDGKFVYCSEPYKPGQYDQIKGYLGVTGAVQWLNSVAGGVLVGTDDGLISFRGTGLADFTEVRISSIPTWLASRNLTMWFQGDAGAVEVSGILALDNNGIAFITDQFESIRLTSNIDFNWTRFGSGAFGVVDNSYIFSGVMT